MDRSAVVTFLESADHICGHSLPTYGLMLRPRKTTVLENRFRPRDLGANVEDALHPLRHEDLPPPQVPSVIQFSESVGCTTGHRLAMLFSIRLSPDISHT